MGRRYFLERDPKIGFKIFNLASHIKKKDFFYVVRSGDFQIIIDDVVSGSLGSSV